MTTTEFVEQTKQKIQDGETDDEIIAWLHEQNLDIITSMKIIAMSYQMSLGSAKKIVSQHAVWQSIVKNSQSLHDDLERIALSEQPTTN
jgi:hypothetical protein